MRSARSILRGDVGKIGLPPLLTMLEMEGRGGILVVQRGGQLGRVFLRDGRVVRAQVEGRPNRTGVDAVCEMVSWERGQFELWHAEIDEADEIRSSTTFLLMEAARRRDEVNAAVFGSGDEPAPL